MRFVTQDQQDDDIATAIESREQEVANYDLNVVNFQAMLAGYGHLGEMWPAKIKSFQGQNSHKVAEVLNDADFELFAQYSHRDQIRVLLRTTHAERAKSAAVLGALENAVPAARLAAAEGRVKAAKAAAKKSEG